MANQGLTGIVEEFPKAVFLTGASLCYPAAYLVQETFAQGADRIARLSLNRFSPNWFSPERLSPLLRQPVVQGIIADYLDLPDRLSRKSLGGISEIRAAFADAASLPVHAAFGLGGYFFESVHVSSLPKEVINASEVFHNHFDEMYRKMFP
jgi:hypothetical protein